MQNGRDALVASAYGTWNNVEHRGHPIQRHAPVPFDEARSRQARPSRATIPEETTGGTRLSRPTTQRGTQGTSHSAPRAEGVRWGTVATSATLPRADAVRWGTVATSATLPRDHPGGQTGGTRLSRPPTERRTQGTSHSAPRAEAVRWGTVATSATLPRAGTVRWGTVATSATLPRNHPGRQTGGTRLSRPPTERGVRPRNPPGEPHATRLGQKTKPDANTHLAERDWRREGDLNPRYGD